MSTQVSVWAGWGQCAASENIARMPAFIAKVVHPECKDPDYAWAMLVGCQRERLAMEAGERLPSEVLGLLNTGYEEASGYLENQIMFWASELCYGTIL